MIDILIVEDARPISNLIRLSLSKAGYRCHTAFDGMEAADLLEQRSFDLVLLDVMLPELDGFELMEYIRPKGIPVIFLIVAAYCALVPRIRFIPLLLIAQIFPGMSQGWLLTLATSEAMTGVPHEKRSTAMGFFNAVYAVGLTVFPMFTGSVIAAGGMRTGYALLSVIALASAAFAFCHYRFADR